MLKLFKQLWTKVKYVFVKDAKTDTKTEKFVKLVKEKEAQVVEKIKDTTKKVEETVKKQHSKLKPKAPKKK